MRTSRCTLGLVLAANAAGGLLACNSFDDPADESDTRLVIPTDERPATTSTVPPVPISGGTLHVTSDGELAVAADPDRDRVSIVDLTRMSVRHTVLLEDGDEPGRVVEDAAGLIHVALRRGGAVATIDPANGSVQRRSQVCKAPRGLAYEAATDLLHVACAEGRLVSISARGGELVRTLSFEPDLRDVILRGSELWVTRFKSAEVVRVQQDGSVLAKVALPEAAGNMSRSEDDGNGGTRFETFSVSVVPQVAWRAVPTAEGGAVIVHQEAVDDEIELTEPSVGGSAYGGGEGAGVECGGIVKNTITEIDPDGVVRSRQPFTGPPLPVDVARSPDGLWTAVAHAGLRDFQAPRPEVIFVGEHGGGGRAATADFGGGFSSVSLVSRQLAAVGTDASCTFSESVSISEPVTAVAFTPDNRLVLQTREPAQVLVLRDVPWGTPEAVTLLGDSRRDTGHDLFHLDSGGGIACASCHPEGGEDGMVWEFAGVGARRTQALHVGLEGTAPFHWDGDLEGLPDIMSEVFVGRMGGVKQSKERLGVLQDWIFGIERPPAIREEGDEAVIRGRELFHSEAVGCGTCHSGSRLTNNETVDVGTFKRPQAIQVPSLVAIGYRAPFLHDGCAETLAGRFAAACGGGDKHGKTEHLDETQVADLVAYLESL